MALNFPGPYEVRLVYSTTPAGFPILIHEQRLNCQIDSAPVPGETFDNITVLTRSGANIALDVAVDDWLVLIKPMFGTTTEFVLAELWKYAPDSFDATFISSYEILELGTGVGATQVAGQVIQTFRTINGGIMRLSFMESSIASGVSQTPPFTPAVFNTIADFVTSASNWIYARDNSYPIARFKVNPGQNEALFKRRFRPN